MLTKSLFMAGERCPKKLWLSIHRPEERKAPDEGVRALMETGASIGRLAQQLYPEGREIPHWHMTPEDAQALTQTLIAEGVPVIFEASFASGKLQARVDILRREGDAWHIIEVKMGASKKDDYVADLAYQYSVLTASGLPVASASLMLVDKNYVWPGDAMEATQFLRLEDCTAECLTQLPEIQDRASAYLTLWDTTDYPVYGAPKPYTDPGLHAECRKCEYGDHCHEHAGEDDIFFLGLHHSRAAKLRKQGIHRIPHLPADFKYSDKEQLQLQSRRENRPIILDSLRAALDQIQYPAHLIDFEAMSPGIPVIPGTKPYDLIPFQWSCHTVDPDAWPTEITQGHSEFLHEEPTDPRPSFVQTLLERLRPGGSVLHYSVYERSAIKRMIHSGIPGADELLELIETRLVDLEKIVKEGYVDYRCGGRSSLKVVLPVLAPELSYEGMVIGSGDLAQRRYEATYFPSTPEEVRRSTYEALREYCRLDTWAMVRVLEELKKLAG